jgi:methyl-accepting chemotaxis protein
VAQGDLSQKITVEALGEILQLKDTINKMVDQLNAFASEVTRVAREVGVEGKLGGQAAVPGVAGTWKDLTDNVNMLAGNLTSQVRNIAKVTTAVAQGDLSQKITVEAQGEILALKDTINGINSTIESLRGIVRELTEAGINVGKVSQNMLSAGQEMNAMVTQMSSSVDQIAKGANVQAQQISDASKESEEVGKTASNTLVRAEEMNKMSEVANNAAQEGSKAMVETVKNTDLMLAGSKESVERIVSLSKSSEQIQEIVDVIRDIATQTNILAINAAIEAVRAGKQGKGFAVVAEEVKTLSADSKSQAKKISTLVQSVLKETQETTDTIKIMAGNVELGRRSIDQTSKAFSDINNAVVSTSTTAKEISLAASEQKKSIDSISQSLDKISGIATDTSTTSVQSAEGVKRLIAKMQELTTTAATLTDMSEKL